jgi:hypothetical protein
MRRTHLVLLACCMPMVLGACAAARTDAMESQTKQRDPHLARLYFIRPSGWMAQGGTIGIKVNGQNVGGIAHGSYMFVDRQPGVYTLEVAPPADWAANFQTDVQLAAGSDVLLRDHRKVVGSSAFGGRGGDARSNQPRYRVDFRKVCPTRGSSLGCNAYFSLRYCAIASKAGQER